MTVTTNHPASSYGVPVILNDEGELVDYPEGIKAIFKRLGWRYKDAQEATNKKRRMVQGYVSGDYPPPADFLNVLDLELSKLKE